MLYVCLKIVSNAIVVFGLTGVLPKLSHEKCTRKFLNNFGYGDDLLYHWQLDLSAQMNLHATKTYDFAAINTKEFSAKTKALYVFQVVSNAIVVFGLTGAFTKLKLDKSTRKFLDDFGCVDDLLYH